MSDATLDQAPGLAAPRAMPKATARAKAAAAPAAIRGEEILPDGRQDWQLLVTPGHVRGHRLLDVGKKFALPTLTAGGLGLWLCLSAMTGGVVPIAGAPASMVRALAVDPAHYATIPGYDQKGDYRLAWLAGAVGAPQRGLTPDGWQKLIMAAAQDVWKHGDKVDTYELVPKLATAPIVTRPEKAFAEHAGQLAGGIIAIPKQSGGVSAYVAAWVDGKLALATISPPPAYNSFMQAQQTSPCAIDLGPTPEGCRMAQDLTQLNALKPTTEGK